MDTFSPKQEIALRLQAISRMSRLAAAGSRFAAHVIRKHWRRVRTLESAMRRAACRNHNP